MVLVCCVSLFYLSCCVPCQSSKDSLLACMHATPSSATMEGARGDGDFKKSKSEVCVVSASAARALEAGRTRETAVTVPENIQFGALKPSISIQPAGHVIQANCLEKSAVALLPSLRIFRDIELPCPSLFHYPSKSRSIIKN